ncbi:MAG TPA: helix-hairpin-helix domain-containing protein [Bacteroidia bacterium]|nr:helix-hairpin-helix domain-containing protein [Bacteroidia bacterium]
MISEQMQSEDGDLSNLTENWTYYKSHPLNLNKAKREELADLQLLSDIQINNLLKHREKNGNLISIYELQSIDGFDLASIKKITPFVYVSDNFNSAFFSFDEMLKDGKHEFVTRFQRIIEPQLGYNVTDSIKNIKPNSYYLGDPNRIFARYSFQYNNNVSFVLAGEKDAGEQFGIGGNKIDSIPFNDGSNQKRAVYKQTQGFDFYSGHIAVRNIKSIKTLVIGDYQATFGQGLTLWQGFAFGKSASPMNVKRYGMGIKPYRSFDENRFFRGAAGTFRIKDFEVTGLASYKKLDANVVNADTASNGEIDVVGVSSLETGGLHNTNSLMQDKGTIEQYIFGGNAAYNKRNLHIGVTAYNMNLSAQLIKTPSLYNQFDFQGKSNFVGGADYNYIFRNANLFGEYSISANGGKAFCQGLILALDPKLTLTAHYRHFEKNFQNLYGNAISENTLPQNEKSLYLGMEAKLFKSLTLSVFLDQYKFDYFKSSASAPSTGRDIFTQLNYTPTKKIDMYFRFRHRTKFINSTDDNFYDYLAPYVQYNYRYNLSAQITPDIKFKSRIEYTHIDKSVEPDEDGVAFVQDIIYKKMKFPFTFTLRYAVFDTKSYDSRVYAYENDVLYSYSVPALYYKGQRAYFIVNWDITRNFEIWVRVASTIYDNQTQQSVGSLNQIDSNHKTELKLQARLKF